jgi:polysaccharide biosynthesis transport protein
MTEPIKNVKYYLNILLKRKLFFIVPFLVVLITVVTIGRWLPSVYQSISTILIEEQQIPPEYVKSTITGFADQRIQSLSQQILSRTKLWEIINQMQLYPELKKNATREEITDRMRSSINVDMISAEVGRGRSGGAGGGVTIAFTIAYRGKNPAIVQKVAGVLASLYLEQNLKTREAQAQTTTRFLEAELKELDERIKALGDKIAAFKEKYEGMLPEQTPYNRAQMDRIEAEIKQLETSIKGANERKIYLQSQLEVAQAAGSTAGDKVLSPKERLRALEISMADLQSKFSEDHPEIRKLRREITELQKLQGQKSSGDSLRRQKLVQLKAELAEKQGKYSDQHPEVKKLKGEIANLERGGTAGSAGSPETEPTSVYISLNSQIHGAENDMQMMRQQQAALKEKLQIFRQRLEQAIRIEQEYNAYMRDYQNAHTKHQEVLNKILEARISEGMEEHQKAEKFTLIDAASYPETPISPKRNMIYLAGVFFSVISGLGSVFLADMLDHSVKRSDELAWLTGLPVLGTIIRIQTNEDIVRAQHRRKLIWVIAGVCLILGLALCHFFYMDLWILIDRLLRKFYPYI